MNENSIDRRAGYIAGLRDLADRLERYDDLPLPYQLKGGMTFYAHDVDTFVAAVKRLGGGIKTNEDGVLTVRRQLDGLPVRVALLTEQVCERVQVGTEVVKVERVVTPAVTEEVEEEVPVYETRCPDSILKLADTEAVPA